MKISEIMTPNPVCVAMDEPVRVAKRKLAENQINHLPVLDHQKEIAGILTDRIIKLQQAVSEDPQFHNNAKVSDVYVQFPYCVSPDMPAHRVLKFMSEEHISSALITSGTRLVGIFTSMDACRVLAEMLSQN